MQNPSVWGHKMVHSIDQWELENLHFEVYLNKTQKKTKQKTLAFVAGGNRMLEGRWRERTCELSSQSSQDALWADLGGDPIFASLAVYTLLRKKLY